LSAEKQKRSVAKSLLIGVAAALGLSALGLDTSVSLSTLGYYFGTYGPFYVIAGVPIFLDVVFALALIRSNRVMRYSMIFTGVVMSLVLGYQFFVSIYLGLIPGG
jgi:hypothetical protein